MLTVSLVTNLFSGTENSTKWYLFCSLKFTELSVCALFIAALS